MPQLREAQIIECFHLAFLQLLPTRLNRASYILKGGVNLRYFFESVRYSEDIDFDVEEAESWELRDKVDHVLASPAMTTVLRAGGLTVAEIARSKQTETTQRWKIGLEVAGRDDPVRTKVEFSRRNGDERYMVEAVPGRVVRPYALRAPTVTHYNAEAAVEQKVRALALRNETQARDVFDLDLLFHGAPDVKVTADASDIERAIEHALELPYAAFRDQVLPFLDPEIADLYDEDAWLQMQLYVVDRLREAL
jgi:predicted nucleotidyltransferase component of viral defense system